MFEKKTLANGVRIVYEYIPYVRSASLGIWVGTGSRYEKAGENGASHFIEHMVFKGTGTRSATDIAAITDRIGGQINAFTTKECTCFYGRVLDTHIDLLLDLLCDMVFDSKFSQQDVDNERNVIFEEIGMYEDTPDDLVTERLFSGIYKGSSLARPILGRKPTLSKMDGSFLKNYMKTHYSPENTVVALSGNFTPSDIDNIADHFSGMDGSMSKFKPAKYRSAFTLKRKNIEQNHLNVAFPGAGVNDDSRYALLLLSGILGGGVSSRLFQNIREKYGLCYNVYSFTSSYLDTGVLGIYTATSSATQSDALKLILREIESIRENGVTDTELSLAKEQAKSNILMSLESTSSRMTRIGRSELFSGRVLLPEEMIERYDSVTKETIKDLAGRLLTPDSMSFSAVGKILHEDEYRKILKI